MKSKNEVASCLDKAFVNLKTMIHPHYSFCFLRVDNGTEFVHSNVEQVLRNFEIQYQHSEAYNHEHELN